VSDITKFEQEFLARIILPNNGPFGGDWFMPQIDKYRTLVG
jgi:hypothetical protein